MDRSTEYLVQAMSKQMAQCLDRAGSFRDAKDYSALSSNEHFHSEYVRFLAEVNLTNRNLVHAFQEAISEIRETTEDYNTRSATDSSQEEMVKQAAQSLEYVHSVLRDMQSPLADVLKESEQTIDQESKNYWDQVSKTVNHLGDQVQDLLSKEGLDMSKVDREVLTTQDQTKLAEICDGAREMLSELGIDFSKGLSFEDYADVVLVTLASQSGDGLVLSGSLIEKIKEIRGQSEWKKQIRSDFSDQMEKACRGSFQHSDASHKDLGTKIEKVVRTCQLEKAKFSTLPIKQKDSNQQKKAGAAERFENLGKPDEGNPDQAVSSSDLKI